MTTGELLIMALLMSIEGARARDAGKTGLAAMLTGLASLGAVVAITIWTIAHV